MPFIVIEGLDGAGKSTQVRMLADMLAQQGRAFEYLHFPRFDAPVYGELIARFLRGELGRLEDVNPYLVALIFAGDRADAAATIRGWLAEGKWVVTDRYVYSNVAYQCAKLPSPDKYAKLPLHDERTKLPLPDERVKLRDWILDLEYGYNKIPVPDISLFLDVPFSFTEERLRASRRGADRDYLNGSQDIHEASLELQHNVREMYLLCAGVDNRLQIIDCGGEDGRMARPEVIFGKIRERIESFL